MGCPGKKAACLVAQPLKVINFIFKNISDRMELSQPVATIPSQFDKCASPLPYNANQVTRQIK